MNKISLRPVAMRYLETLVDDSTGRTMLTDVIVQIIMPVAFGVAFYLLWPDDNSKWPLGEKSISELSSGILTVVSIVSALLCGVAIMIFQLRLQLASQTNPVPEERETRLIDQMFNQVLWDVVAGFATTLFLACSNAFTSGSTLWKISLSASLITIINFVLVTCMCIKRFSSAYDIISKQWRPKGQ